MRRFLAIIAAIFCIIIAALADFHAARIQQPNPIKGLYIPFDESMQLAQFPAILNRPDFSYVYNTCKNLYEQHNFTKLMPSITARIPKVIHIMWLGGKLPQEYVKYVQSWQQYHPQWTILFWTDSKLNYDQGTQVVHSFSDLEQLLQKTYGGQRIVIDASTLQFDNRVFYDQARNYGEKSDILKWEIVYRFGGTYVDTDFECLQPLDIYHHTYDFFTGIQPLDTNMVQLGAALYGAIPHHPILKGCVEGIKDNQHIAQIIVKTGPIHFTKTFLALAGKTNLRDIALPSSFFYPCGYEQRGTAREIWCKTESYAVHHWAGSWLKPEAFVQT
jgi:mannosyltransferase OCH1-like enzyme